MLYYADGTRQIQQADWWFEAPHATEEIVRRTCTDAKRDAMMQLYPGAVFIEGFWTADDWYATVVDRAMASTWEF